MQKSNLSFLVSTACMVGALCGGTAQAANQSVSFANLTASATVATPIAVGDTLLVNTLVTNEVGSLMQSVTFTVGAGATSFIGGATWQISTAAGPGPRLIGVNIDIFGPGNVLVGSDTITGTLGGFAVSSLAGAITPGIYTMVATGTGVRESVMDISVSIVPEPGALLLMLAGLGAVGFIAVRRSAV